MREGFESGRDDDADMLSCSYAEWALGLIPAVSDSLSDTVLRPWDVERNRRNAGDEGGTILIRRRDPLVAHRELQDDRER